MKSLVYRERPAAGQANGLLVLHHGRGSDEQDLLGLAEVLDPTRLLHVVTPRAPFQFDWSPGYHWYVVPRVGFPDPATFHCAFDSLASLHDDLWRRTGIGPDRTILGGFSMGSVMSYATGLARDRPSPAGILAFSGFIPTVDGWAPSIDDRPLLRAFIAHGRRDEIMDVGFARRARELLVDGGLEVDYHETDAGHEVDSRVLPRARAWLAGETASQDDLGS